MKEVIDLPEGKATETLAQKLRDARDQIGMSRAKVAEETGIPSRTLEKYEDGSSEPPLGRLRDLCELYGVPLPQMIGIEGEAEKSGNSGKSGEGETPKDVTQQPETLEGEDPGLMAASDEPKGSAQQTLEMIDGCRQMGLAKHRRRVKAVSKLFMNFAEHLEFDQLFELAIDRGVYDEEILTDDGYHDLYDESPEKAEAGCRELALRILDTALFGVDLYAIERDALVKLADQLSDDETIDERFSFGPDAGFLGMGWGSHDDFVPNMREPLLYWLMAGHEVVLDDMEIFPRRDPAAE